MKRKWIALVMSAFCLAASVSSTVVLADGQKVVTLGADLSEEQKQAILRYFGVAGQNLQTLIITNQDERNHLGSYVPLEQIGTHTYSCALVNPTSSGGIQVKTANLSWVTSNMIATTLSTSGVVNCEVLAASPFEVSGTGALTGILMAYESAVGQTLDPEKKEIATQEMITTTTIANTIGQQQATEIVNDSKMQVIQGNQVTQNDIDVIVNEVAEEKNIALSDEDRELLYELLAEIAEQDYNYEEMKETLERVENNMDELSSQIEGASTVDTDEAEELYLGEDETETPETLAADSILVNTDDTALGQAVTFDATDESALTQTEAPVQTEAPAQTEAITITTSDSYSEGDTGTDTPDGQIEGAETVDQGDAGTDITVAPAQTDAAVVPAETEPAVTPVETDAAVVPAETEPAVTPAEDGIVSDENGGEDFGEIPDENGGEELGEIPDDGLTAEEGEEGDGGMTLELEMIPISDFVLAPQTSDATSYEVYPAGLNELTISFERDDIIAGSGTLTVYDAANSTTYETVNMSDSSKVAVVPLDSEELSELGWSGGNKAVISLSNPLAQDSTYFVILSQDALATENGTGTSEAIGDSSAWMIQTSEYGFFLNRTAAGFSAGSTVSGEILMDDTAASYADIENADSSMVTFDQTEFWATGSLTATFQQPGETTFQVVFYDDAGTVLKTMDYTVEIS